MDRKNAAKGSLSTAVGPGVGEGAHDFWLTRAMSARTASKPRPRHSVRRALTLEALLNHGMTYSVPWRVRDLSLTGAFVEIDAAHLPEGSYVEFVLRYNYEEKAIELRIPATVARIQKDGAALIFNAYDDDTYTRLTNLLYAL
jgi:hypothetical protein